MIAIITARGGSKRIPRKNIRLFAGKPIIAYSIEAAFKSGLFSEVMVSTDDEEIAEVSKRSGASVPFLRSKANSDDYSTTEDVLHEVLNEYRANGSEFDFCCCIYPTAPFITAERLKVAATMLGSNTDSVFPVLAFSYPIQRALQADEDMFLSMIHPENEYVRSQDLEKSYYDAGQFYFFRVSSFIASKKIIGDRCKGMVISDLEAQDIDVEEDWQLAEFKFRYLQDRNFHKI